MKPKRTFSSGTDLCYRKQADACRPRTLPDKRGQRIHSPAWAYSLWFSKKRRARRRAIERLAGFSPPPAWRAHATNRSRHNALHCERIGVKLGIGPTVFRGASHEDKARD